MAHWFAELWGASVAASPPRVGEGLEVTLTHTWPWPPWVALVVMLGGAACVIWLYWREAGSVRRPARWGMAALRITLLAVLLTMLHGWMRNRYRTELPDVVVVVDDSGSMDLVDRHDASDVLDRLRSVCAQLGLTTASRLNLAKALLLDPRDGWLQALAQRYSLKVHLLGATARIQTGEGDELAAALRAVEAREPASRLGDGLQQILEAQRGRPTAAIVLLTDGITTEGKSLSEAAQAARRRGIPLYLLGVGDQRPPRDVRLTDLLVDDTVFLGDAVHFDFTLTGRGFDAEPVQLWLKQRDRDDVLARQAITLPGDGTARSIRMTYAPTAAGEFEFVVGAEPLANESNLDNNRLVQRVRVQDETIRVLFVQEYPSWEFRNLKALLQRSRQGPSGRPVIALTTVLQEADLEYADLDASAARVFPVSRDELFGFDVVLFGDVNPSYLSRPILENLAAFVVERGGGIGFLSGPRYTPLAYRGTPLEDLFPIDLETASLPDEAALLQRSWRVRPTRIGSAAPHLQLTDTLADNAALWQSLPPLRWILQAPDTRLGAQVLVETVADAAAGEAAMPVVCTQYVGAGRVVWHATDETYLWSRFRGSDLPYERYWTQTIRFLSRTRLLGGSRRVELVADRAQYHRGEPAALQVRFWDERTAPSADDGVVVVVEQSGGRRQRVKLQRDALRRGIFDGVVTNLAEGTYRAWLAAPSLEDKPPTAAFAVVPPPGEQARLVMDVADLRLAAETSQGRFEPLASASRLLEDLPRGRQVRIESLPSEPLWNSPWLAAICVLLLTGEWLWRRRVGWL